MTEKKALPPEIVARNLAVGARIRERRLKKGYTQAQLGPMIGLSANACAQWESGKAMPKIENLEALGLLFECSTEWLMAGNDTDELAKVHTTAERDLLSIMRAIPSNQHPTVLAVLRGFTHKPNKD